MADPEALEMLRRGAAAWNAWRRKDRTADLTTTNFNAFDFRGFRLFGIDFSGCDFTSANFEDCRIGDVRFVGVNARHISFKRVRANDVVFKESDFLAVSFQQAQFDGALVARCFLRSANFQLSSVRASHFDTVALSHAVLLDGHFANSTFVDVDFDGAAFGDTVLSSCIIERPNGLESTKHYARSSVDIQTLLETPLPEPFLRGIGLPDTVIEYLDSLRGRAIEYYSCFLSYSSKDDEFARRLYNDLQARGIRTWFAPEDLKIGDRFRKRIDESIHLRDKLVVILSVQSVASDWVETEVEAALERERKEKRSVLFPIAIDEDGFSSDEPWAADIRRKRHIGDFRKWKSHDDYTAAFERLVRDLKKG